MATLTVKDASVRRTLSKALHGDGNLSYSDVKSILASTLDGGGVSRQEYNDLQHILKNSSSIDSRSRELITNFLNREYKPAVKPLPAGQLTTNFNVSEFACNDGTAVPSSLLANVKELAKNLQVLRDTIKKPIRINSSYRTASHNKAVGGVSSSQHLVAKAADIVVKGLTPSGVKEQIEELIADKKMSQGGIGLYNTFVHYDIRGTRARW